MVYNEMRFFSEVLQLSVAMTVLMPSGHTQGRGKIPVLYLLHGKTDDHSSWVRYTSIERYLQDKNLAVVMPEVHLSYYQNMKFGPAYYNFISQELMEITEAYFPVADIKKNRFISGLSMGGFGAFKTALNNPEMFSCAGSFSGVLDLPSWVDECIKGGEEAQRTIFTNCFGENPQGKNLINTKNDLIGLLKDYEASSWPKLYQSCGKQDFLYQNNQTFRKACEHWKIPITYRESDGMHSWDFWDRQIASFLSWLPI